jgi:hypothetical protein
MPPTPPDLAPTSLPEVLPALGEASKNNMIVAHTSFCKTLVAWPPLLGPCTCTLQAVGQEHVWRDAVHPLLLLRVSSQMHFKQSSTVRSITASAVTWQHPTCRCLDNLYDRQQELMVVWYTLLSKPKCRAQGSLLFYTKDTQPLAWHWFPSC